MNSVIDKKTFKWLRANDFDFKKKIKKRKIRTSTPKKKIKLLIVGPEGPMETKKERYPISDVHGEKYEPAVRAVNKSGDFIGPQILFSN